MIHIPTGFFEHHFKYEIKTGCLTIKGGYNQRWSVTVKNVSGCYQMRGFKKVCDEIPLHFMAYVIFHFESSKSLRINVYKPNGIEAMLPLNENEICGVLE
ncbi:hypothetical protein R6Q59_010259 [Mikania micrantha]